MIHNVILTVPLEKLTKVELAAESNKFPEENPATFGLATEVRCGRKGAAERFWLTLHEDKAEPAIAFVGLLHQSCMDRWGPGMLDLIDGGFVWVQGTVTRK